MPSSAERPSRLLTTTGEFNTKVRQTDRQNDRTELKELDVVDQTQNFFYSFLPLDEAYLLER